MERFHREQPMVEDVMFDSLANRVFAGKEYFGAEGGVVEAGMLPVDPMVGLQVPPMFEAPVVEEPAEEPAEDDVVKE